MSWEIAIAGSVILSAFLLVLIASQLKHQVIQSGLAILAVFIAAVDFQILNLIAAGQGQTDIAILMGGLFAAFVITGLLLVLVLFVTFLLELLSQAGKVST